MSAIKNKAILQTYCRATNGPVSNLEHELSAFFHAEAAINIVHPFNKLDGPLAYLDNFLQPLMHSFAFLNRTDYIAITGDFNDESWVACTGYYRGQFEHNWLGIKPTGALAFLRFAEFHRIEDGKFAESYMYLDIPALMMAAGCWPLNQSIASHPGYTGYLPGPSTNDGLQWGENEPIHARETLQLTETMLLNLATVEETWRPYWHDNMIWYGPAVFGAFYGKEEFAAFQTPFEQCFSEWISGIMPGSRTKHFLRMADGDYSCLGGWPSLNMVQVKPFLGLPATDKRVYMRVCDFWRRDGEKLAENWVFVDALHFLLQLDCDVLSMCIEE